MACLHKKIFLLIWITISVKTFSSQQVYRTCKDVKTILGDNAKDGEYFVFVSGGVGVRIYCSGLNTSLPREYLSLPAGRSNNFAYIYEHIGMPNLCKDNTVLKMFPEAGRSEFLKIRFSAALQTVDIDDFTFAKTIFGRQIRYGTAGDNFSFSSKCPPRGKFKVDLTGTPFVINHDVQWVWKGIYSDGSSNGTAHLSQSRFLGCYKDRWQRALPSGFMKRRSMTVEMCISHCSSLKFYYAGVEYGAECWCGDAYDRHGPLPMSKCQMKCSGNRTELCGGNLALSVYSTATAQVLMGTCGGYSGECYPAMRERLNTPALAFEISSHHPCYKNRCGRFAVCVALSAKEFKCICPKNFSGSLCETPAEKKTVNGSCPVNYEAEQCSCAKKCYGAKFQGHVCVVSPGKAKPYVVCRFGDPGHTFLFNVDSNRQYVSCPSGSKIVGCSYWDSKKKYMSYGKGTVDQWRNACSVKHCSGCNVQARCRKYLCGCKNGGICEMGTDVCKCPPGYSGGKCESFDYCAFYEDSYNETVCSNGGTCQAVSASIVNTYGGHKSGDHCLFPFTYQNETFGQCVSDNEVGPPFACQSNFDGKNSYIDLGKWNPGTQYTIAAWVKPSLIDSTERLVVGSISDCRNFGISFQAGTFRAYYKEPNSRQCTVSLDTGYPPNILIDRWYLVAVTNDGRNITIYVNGKYRNSAKTQPFFTSNAKGLWIGGGLCCKGSSFKGSLKNIKMWNRVRSIQQITTSMNKVGVGDSPTEAEADGLVGHWELGEELLPNCAGTDHGNQEWTPRHQEQISGTHCNISTFYIPKGTTVFIQRWNGSQLGYVEIIAKQIIIDGTLNGAGAGYRGGVSASQLGASGVQGESYGGMGLENTSTTTGGGGGGVGFSQTKNFSRPGGGGGYGRAGLAGTYRRSGLMCGAGGKPYGSPSLSRLFTGSGGGSGGNAVDLNSTPKGGSGGNGGGAVKLYAQSRVSITGVVNVEGENGDGDGVSTSGCHICPLSCNPSNSGGPCLSDNKNKCWDKSGPGGGGSGGSILISAEFVDIGYNRLLASGGQGGQGAEMCGGDGGPGRIYLEAGILQGSITNAKLGVLTKAKRQDKYVDHSEIRKAEALWQGNDVYLGCFTQPDTSPLFNKLLQLSDTESSRLTPKLCASLCRHLKYVYSGTFKGQLCYCDNHLNTTSQTDDRVCDIPCGGSQLETCGGSSTLHVLGPHPVNSGVGYNGVAGQCVPWCVTSHRDTVQQKWGYCSKTETRTTLQMKCTCPAGLGGVACNMVCLPGAWGRNCRNHCTCNNTKRLSCDRVDGSCKCNQGFNGTDCGQTICPTGTTGYRCQECARPGFWAENCSHVCDCNGAPCDTRTGRCRCPSGRKGDRCEQVCPVGFYGALCAQRCRCRNNTTCNPVDGSCACPPGWFDAHCEQPCPPGYHGIQCSSTCPLCDNALPCHPVTGYCTCDPGLKGTFCNESCEAGSSGVSCADKCPPNCLQNCSPETGRCCQCPNGARCTFNGTCLCSPGYTGTHCANRIRVYKQENKLTTGQIAGIIVGSIACVVVIVVITVYLRRLKTGTLEFEGEVTMEGVRPVSGFDNPLVKE